MFLYGYQNDKTTNDEWIKIDYFEIYNDKTITLKQ